VERTLQRGEEQVCVRVLLGYGQGAKGATRPSAASLAQRPPFESCALPSCLVATPSPPWPRPPPPEPQVANAEARFDAANARAASGRKGAARVERGAKPEDLLRMHEVGSSRV
jgi:hypothetical protein